MIKNPYTKGTFVRMAPGAGGELAYVMGEAKKNRRGRIIISLLVRTPGAVPGKEFEVNAPFLPRWTPIEYIDGPAEDDGSMKAIFQIQKYRDMIGFHQQVPD